MIKVGIIGMGVGEAHIKGYLSHPECKLVGICDFNKKTLSEKVALYPGVEFHSDALAILKNPKIDVVSIASWDNFHYEQILLGFKENKHLFIEKPLCQNEKQARTIWKVLSKKKKIKISSNLILRMCPRFQWLKNEISAGKLGNIYYIEGAYNYGRIKKLTDGWRGQIEYYSINLGGGVHLVDQFLWLTGKRISEVSTITNNLSTKGTNYHYNDLILSMLRFEDNSTGRLTSNGACVMPHFHELNVYGTEATFVNQPENGLLFRSRNSEVDSIKIDLPYPGLHKGDLIFDFIESIIKDTEPKVGKKEIFDSMSVCFAIEKSMNTGKSHKVGCIYE